MLKKIRTLFLVFFALGSIFEGLDGIPLNKIPQKTHKENTDDTDPLENYILPKGRSLNLKLKSLFTNSNMFSSENEFRKAGFRVKAGHRKLMVGAHPKIPGFLIKKFQNSMPFPLQMDNFLLRIKGANKIREFIASHNFVHLVVPQKWLYELPKNFVKFPAKRNFVLVVEDMNIIDDLHKPDSEVLKLYYNMSKEMLTELTMLLHGLNGCDAMPRNQPFTKSGKIAFVDTEHVGRLKGHFLKHVVPVLNDQNQKFAIKLWNRLENEERARAQANL